MDGIERARFDHIGVITDERQDGEVFVDATRVWVTNPRDHPFCFGHSAVVPRGPMRVRRRSSSAGALPDRPDDRLPRLSMIALS